MTDIADIQLEIKAVKFALKSFARFRDEEQRKDHLRSQFDTVQNLDIYFGFSEDKLQDALNKLQDALNKLQEKENLLLAQQQGE
jgi:endonuclease IV